MSNSIQPTNNQSGNGTVSTMENTPVYVPKITLTNSGGDSRKPAAKNGTKTEAQDQRSPKLGLVYSIVGFVFGILSLIAVIILGLFSIPMSVVGFAALIPYGIGIVLSIMGIVLSSMGRKEGDTTGLAKAGIIMSVIPLVILGVLMLLTILGIAACTSCVMMAASEASQGAAAIL